MRQGSQLASRETYLLAYWYVSQIRDCPSLPHEHYMLAWSDLFTLSIRAEKGLTYPKDFEAFYRASLTERQVGASAFKRARFGIAEVLHQSIDAGIAAPS